MKNKIEREKISLTREKGGIVRERVKIIPSDPDFESVFDDGDENLFAGIEMTGDLQEDADSTMSEALRQIIERKKATQERFRVATDPEFFICVCFQSREQKNEFLRLAGWDDLGDKYINGLDVARRLGVGIQIVPIAPLKLRGKVGKFKPDDILGKE